MSQSMEGQVRVRRSRLLLLTAFVGAGAGVAVAVVALRMSHGLAGFLVAMAALALSAVSLHASMRWWGHADEAVREAHKTGWYWGGSIGLGVAAGLLGLLFSLDPSVSLRQFALLPGDAGLIATGIALAIGLAFAGYLICWAGWWLFRGR
ncbi:MAG: hypothetical protein KF842_15055 [Caulobacter sp.]|nr:hypothetical protein [Caulobacter sp.]